MPGCLVAKAKVAGSSPVFRCKVRPSWQKLTGPLIFARGNIPRTLPRAVDQRHRAAQRRIPPAPQDAGLAAERGRRAGAALRPDRDGQIRLRKIDGYRKLAEVISEQMRRAACCQGGMLYGESK